MPLRAHGPYGIELSIAPRAAMASARPLVLDSHSQLPHERSRVRHRMAYRAVPALFEIGPRLVLAQLHSVHLDAGVDFQHLDPARRASARRVELDVAGPYGLLFSPASRRHRQ